MRTRRPSDQEDHASQDDEATWPAHGETIGRYVLLHRLGRGAMGVVHAAYDPELDRKIVLKLLDARGALRYRDVLLIEAQTLAKLTHPNVVAVHDVGTHGDRVFVAMEYVAGKTLRTALSAGAMPWQEILRLLLPAGRGLAAAHAAGIVHRDFKPENVLLGTDGRVCVADFGIARPTRSSREHSLRDSTTPSASLDTTDVLAKTLSGTAAYMPPEQFVRAQADVRSDQFAFCVVLFEALTGTLPFATTMRARKLEILDHRELRWPAGSSPPRWLRRVISKGLSFDPARRYPSMDALLFALERKPRSRRVLVGSSTIAAATLVLVGVLAPSKEPDTHCLRVEQHLEGIWDDETRARVLRGVDDEQASRLDAILDRYAQRWMLARKRVCEAKLVEADHEARLAHQRACLDVRLQRFAALVELLDRADPYQARKAARALPSVQSCMAEGDVPMLAPPDDEATHVRVVELQKRVAHMHAALDLSLPPPDDERIRDVLEQARELGHAPLLANVLLAHARSALETGQGEAAERSAMEALVIAARLKHDPLLARGWLVVLRTIDHSNGRPEAFERVAQAAELATLRHGDDDLYFDLLMEIGEALGRRQRFEEATRRFEEAIALISTLPDTDPSMHAQATTRLGTMLEGLGDYDAAARKHAQAFELFEATLGPKHPELALILTDLGRVHAASSDFEAALTYHQRAIAMLEDTRGLDSLAIFVPLVERGFVLVDLDRPLEAQQHFARAIAIAESEVERSHPFLHRALIGLGRTLVDTARPAEALTVLERAQTLLSDELSDEPLRGELLFALARATLALDDDIERVRELCTAAADDFIRSGKAPERVEALERWRNEHEL